MIVWYLEVQIIEQNETQRQVPVYAFEEKRFVAKMRGLS